MKSKERLPDGELIICRCEEVTKQEIVDTIRDGCITVHDVRKRTRGGMGFCQGKTCARQIQMLINQYAGKDISKLLTATARPPVRPIPVEVFVKGDDLV